MAHELNHIAFIPDGNRRWARRKSFPALKGHQIGYDRFKDVADWCLDRGIHEVSLWGFSTENWKRSQEEVGWLMDLFLKMLTVDLKEFAEREIRLKVIGRRSDLSDKMRSAIEDAEATTKDYTKGQVNLFFNYGGHPEIIEGVKRCIDEGLTSDQIDDELFTSKLWTAGTSNPDLIVRTSGEQRLSGFIPWSGAYSELYFSRLHWPAFSEEELDAAIASYKDRERRFGGNG